MSSILTYEDYKKALELYVSKKEMSVSLSLISLCEKEFNIKKYGISIHNHTSDFDYVQLNENGLPNFLIDRDDFSLGIFKLKPINDYSFFLNSTPHPILWNKSLNHLLCELKHMDDNLFRWDRSVLINEDRNVLIKDIEKLLLIEKRI